jgi:hypothetical protein
LRRRDRHLLYLMLQKKRASPNHKSQSCATATISRIGAVDHNSDLVVIIIRCRGSATTTKKKICLSSLSRNLRAYALCDRFHLSVWVGERYLARTVGRSVQSMRGRELILKSKSESTQIGLAAD